MSPSRIRYVTACQQLLALGVVLAALAPAAGVVSLDVVREAPGAGRGMSIGTGAAVTSAFSVAAGGRGVSSERVGPAGPGQVGRTGLHKHPRSTERPFFRRGS